MVVGIATTDIAECLIWVGNLNWHVNLPVEIPKARLIVTRLTTLGYVIDGQENLKMSKLDWSKAKRIDLERFKNVKFEMASDDQIQKYVKEVDRVLTIFGHPEALVTDESTAWEFLTEENSLEQVSEDIGFKVYASDPICYLAFRLSKDWEEESKEVEKVRNEQGESAIPKGCYCYSSINCPYWDKFTDFLPEQYSGFCWFLMKGDWQIETEMTLTSQDGKECKGNELPFPVSLLWDQCKKCDINDDDDSLYAKCGPENAE